MNTSIIMDGKSVAESELDRLKQVVRRRSVNPSLHVVLVGEDEASLSYIRQKTKSADRVNIDSSVHSLPADCSSGEVLELLDELNKDSNVDGIIVQLPLPPHLEEQSLLQNVSPSKDVDGLHPFNFGRLLSGEQPLYLPPTPQGIMMLLDHYDVDLHGINVALVGMGRLVGRPLSQMLVNRDATVLCLNEFTGNIRDRTRQADVVVVACGEPELVDERYITDGTIVIDVGIHRQDGELVGDVDFDSVASKAKLVSPVPGGVGPLTVACLLSNTVVACEESSSVGR